MHVRWLFEAARGRGARLEAGKKHHRHSEYVTKRVKKRISGSLMTAQVARRRWRRCWIAARPAGLPSPSQIRCRTGWACPGLGPACHRSGPAWTRSAGGTACVGGWATECHKRPALSAPDSSLPTGAALLALRCDRCSKNCAPARIARGPGASRKTSSGAPSWGQSCACTRSPETQLAQAAGGGAAHGGGGQDRRAQPRKADAVAAKEVPGTGLDAPQQRRRRRIAPGRGTGAPLGRGCQSSWGSRGPAASPNPRPAARSPP